MVACNGFAATGGTAVVDDAAVAEFVVAVFGVEVDVSATGVTAGAGAGDGIGGTTAADTGDSGGAAAGGGVGGSTGAPQAYQNRSFGCSDVPHFLQIIMRNLLWGH